MTSTAHTPGPWVAETYQGRTTRLRVRTAEQAVTICQVTALIHKEANARLIAASPTLYEYVAKKANEGDADAARIIASI